MSAHTPGPWRINRDWLPESSPQWREIVSGWDANYRRMSVSGNCGEADARLIAAAPDLLAFAKFVIESYHSDEGMPESKVLAREARAAIAKAEGNS